MVSFQEILSTRDIANILIISVFVIFVLKKADVRNALKPLVKFVFCSKLTIIYALPIMYLSFFTFVLYKFHLWDFSLIKDTLLFFVFSTGLAGRSINPTNFGDEYKEKLLGYVSIMYFVGFVVDFYTYNLFFEIIIVSIATLISIMLVAVEYFKDTPEQTKKFLTNIQTSLGILIILHSLYWIIKEPIKFFCIHSLQTLLLPIFYIIVLIPLCYGIFILCRYESTLTSINVVESNLKRKTSKNEVLFKTFLVCGFSTERLALWLDFYHRLRNDFEEEQTLDTIISEFRNKYKKSNFSETTTGFNPEIAKLYLSNLNFGNSIYKFVNWTDGFGNYQALSYNNDNKNMIYSVEGNQQSAQLLHLHDFILGVEKEDEELVFFANACKDLYKKVFSENLKKKYVNKIKQLKAYEFEKDNITIKFYTDTDARDNIAGVSFDIFMTKPQEYSDYEIKITNP